MRKALLVGLGTSPHVGQLILRTLFVFTFSDIPRPSQLATRLPNSASKREFDMPLYLYPGPIQKNPQRISAQGGAPNSSRSLL